MVILELADPCAALLAPAPTLNRSLVAHASRDGPPTEQYFRDLLRDWQHRNNANNQATGALLRSIETRAIPPKKDHPLGQWWQSFRVEAEL